MTDLPAGWEWATLGELAASVKNGIFVSRPGAEPNGVPILRINAVRSLRLDLCDLRYCGKSADDLREQDALLRPGDLLFTRYSGSSEYVGVCAHVPDGIGDLTYPDKLIRVRTPGIDTRYLAAAFASPRVRSSVERVLRTTAGQVGISGNSLKEVRLPVAPLAEQQRIVAVLEDHLSRMEAGYSALDTAERRLSHLHEQVVAHAGNGAFLEAENLTSSRLPDVGLQDGTLPPLPQRWKWVRLHEIADVVGGVTKDAKRQTDPTLVEVPYLRVANVQRGRIDLSHVATIRVPREKVDRLALRPGDVLLNEGGDRDKLARGWVWEGQLPLCIHQNHVFRARVRDDVLDPRILAWHANSFGKAWAEANGKQSVNLASISLSKIRLLPVPIPPKADQQRIVMMAEEQLSVVDRLRRELTKIEDRADQLRKAVLADAFAGRLLPQDPRDEPASVLLERVRSERAAQPNARRGRRTKNTTQETLL